MMALIASAAVGAAAVVTFRADTSLEVSRFDCEPLAPSLWSLSH